MDTLALRTLNRATLQRQWLLERADRTALDAVEHLAGMQAQAPLPPYGRLWCRLRGVPPRRPGRAPARPPGRPRVVDAGNDPPGVGARLPRVPAADSPVYGARDLPEPDLRPASGRGTRHGRRPQGRPHPAGGATAHRRRTADAARSALAGPGAAG